MRDIIKIEPDLSLVLDGLGSDKSRAVYRTALLRFHGWWVAMGKPALTKALVQWYKVVLCESGLAPATVNVALASIRKLALECGDNGLLDPNVAAAIGRVPGVRNNGRRCGQWLTREQARLLIDAPGSGIIGLRDRAILACMVGAGLRRSEVVSLQLYHFQQRDSRWVIVDLVGKGNRVRSIPIADWVYDRVRRWLEEAEIHEGCIFRRIYRSGRVGAPLSDRAVYDIIKKYTDVTPHDLRRSWAKLAHKGGSPIEQIQLSLGHSTIQTTMAYLGVEQDTIDAPGDRLQLEVQ